MGARTIPSAQIGHFQESESRHSPSHRSDPQHSLHDRDLLKTTTKLWPRFSGHSPWTEKDQPRSEHCSRPQKGTGAQSIAASRSNARETRSQTSKSLSAWGRNTDPQNDYESSPLWRRRKMSSQHAKILTNPRFEREFRILFACFSGKRATRQILREFRREKDTLSLTRAYQLRKKGIKNKKNSSGPRKQKFWVQKYKYKFN